MKIIAGSLRGRPLRAPRGSIARPMRAQVREALFQQFEDLGARLEGGRVLDLFAGSGSLGFEALSRGAARVAFVEIAPPCIAAIEGNAEDLGVKDRAIVLRLNLAQSLANHRRSAPDAIAAELRRPFDLVLMDPPFGLLREVGASASGPDVRKILAELGSGRWLADGAVIAFEAPARTFRIEGLLGDLGLELALRREYGTTSLWILTPKQRSAQ